jgi:hypothetical protein
MEANKAQNMTQQQPSLYPKETWYLALQFTGIYNCAQPFKAQDRLDDI